jgi:hypothetical protein
LQKYLKAIDKDRKPYTLEVDEVKVNESLMKRELSRSDSSRLSRQLSKRYPGMPITQALRNENEMLRRELQRLRVRPSPPSSSAQKHPSLFSYIPMLAPIP